MHTASSLAPMDSASASPTPFSASPSPFRMWSSVPASTAPSSPPPDEEEKDSPFLAGMPLADADMPAKGEEAPKDAAEDEDEDEPITADEQTELDARYKRLEHVLQRSVLYSTILKQQMDDAKEAHQASLREARRVKEAEAARPVKRARRGKAGANSTVTEDAMAAAAQDDDAFPQPALVTGARLKDYQLEGLQWMVSLNTQGISGILADEMGLGKTLQTIAFSAHLRELGFSRPFLIVCPLSVLHNWVEEYKKFAPGIPVLMYHGTPAERAEMRRTVLPMPDGFPVKEASTSAAPASPPARGRGRGRGRASASGSAPTRGRASASTSASAPASAPASPSARGGRGRGRGGARGRGRGRGAATGTGRTAAGKRKRATADDSDDEEEEEEEEILTPAQKAAKKAKDARDAATKKLNDAHDAHFGAFPVVITTYDLIIRDRVHLAAYPWGYIVVDEGHRLKNMNCALMREIKKFGGNGTGGRMVLTGTPLHNNLAELWSLLNFILPDIFDDVDAFQEWFALPRMSALLPSARMGTFIATLHTILKPFLLRRMKVDVLGSALPPKKSYVLYARLSVHQREAYEAILGGGVRGWVAGRASASASVSATPAGSSTPAHDAGTPADSSTVADGSTPPDNTPAPADDAEAGRTLRARRRKGKGRASDEDEEARAREEEEERRAAAEAFRAKGAAKHVNNMKLQNTVMQLRKVCSHPFLFARPDDDAWSLGRAPLTPEVIAAREAELLGASGKMLLLDRLLGELFRRGHKVLLFSQFTTMLDILEDWAVDMKGWQVCRIDGTTPPLERRDQMNLFQDAGDAPDAPRLFLLSTRAGGLGVNLTAADTVIFYDQDWNPQMDAQAQDRAHRIGQTRPVLIFRLVSAHTIEEKIMQRATEKRKLEALVIAKGKFKMPAAAEAAAPGRRATMAEMAAELLRLEGEQIDVLPAEHAGADVLSDADLEALLDRSPAVFADRGTGWRSATGAKGQAAFAVFEPPVEEGDDALAGLMGEEAVDA
ncbi:SNF2 family N-terminal domain-containing protein [Mycena epipterygia]|nr:SNF2 family N-terminal domain-containing protein [Mycena epipterygia]